MNSTKQVDHYAEAERLLAEAAPVAGEGGYQRLDLLTAAQVQAQLALVDVQRQIACDERREADAEERVASTVTDTGRVQVLTGRTA